MPEVCISGAFNELRSREVRFLQEAARLGKVTVLLWSDETIRAQSGSLPEFPAVERRYFLESIRYVSQVEMLDGPVEQDRLCIPAGEQPNLYVLSEAQAGPAMRQNLANAGVDYRVIREAQLEGFRLPAEPEPAPSGKKVIVTGCFDWLHSGHIQFFEQAASYGALYVSVGNDVNIRGLKGAGHPLLSQDERTYMVASIRCVRQAFVASGSGWLDVESGLERVKPDIYLVNEDGDRPEKRALCVKYGLQYVVLQRLPKDGLPRRQSTRLRGF
jgi:cytidyltransferase-like protein